ncbi:hypothetical protein L861_17435 [Litchfieldella anticariensis FP35 = DSM 16096]|uniref:VOC domain-containing protein n=1 Tax=Litchfieldella anticariensis (strain DSM 16096 / CECT 5854 / CIP 108499 / LMG 22089 / FP35) TaxID=1121939 RepID=S2KN21_LITA3|nr:VOC family protein [Halomonas anticariensis]EPC03325.1 hypothetical protein L861_17435 [Halomonas anticariensis FP35 = DSM 16096]
MPELGLVVIRVSDLEASRRWYERIGFEFYEEQHGDGPVHYAAVQSGFVFELYPQLTPNPVSSGIRLGFYVHDVHAIVEANMAPESVVVKPNAAFGRLGAVLMDPDGIKVEINESQA